MIVFQRTPGWVIPRVDRARSERSKALFRARPQVQALTRSAWYWAHEAFAPGIVWPSPLTTAIETVARANLRRQVRDPWLRRQLTPDFRAGCKRLLVTSEYYPALQQPHCKLVTWPITRISARGVRTADGIEREVDTLVLATGFDVAKHGSPFPVVGTGGRTLDEEWTEGAHAYRSVAVSGFPNLFLTFGPNSGPGHNSALVYMESQIEHIVTAVRMILDRELHVMEVRPEAQERYNARLQQRLAGTTWASGCRSWYLTADGRNTTLYPGFATQFARATRRVREQDYRLEAGATTARAS